MLITTRHHALSHAEVSKHFDTEKDAIATKFMELLEKRLTSIRGDGSNRKVRLILDAGTTVLPIFRFLMEKKTDPTWADAIEIVTNSLPGISVALDDGLLEDDSRHARTAYRIHVVGGAPAPDYGALLSLNPAEDLARLLGEPGSTNEQLVTIGVTTGNYACNDGRTLFVRGQQHLAFKQALLQHSSVVYSLLPVGKMLPKKADDLNNTLVPQEKRNDENQLYKELEIKLDGKEELVLITTTREPHNRLYPHWLLTHERLKSVQKSSRKTKVQIALVSSDDFNVSRLTGDREVDEEKLEMPHVDHRQALKRWFGWTTKARRVASTRSR